MTKYIKVSNLKVDDDVCLKSQEVSIKGKKITTPLKAVNMAKLRRDTEINNEVKGINEIFKTFNNDKINEYRNKTNDKDEKDILKTINTSYNKTGPDEINLCFVQHEDPKLPEGKSIDFLMNIAYLYSDATPLPILPDFFDDKSTNFFEKYEKYINFMKECIESINRLNNKPIIGIIPLSIPSAWIEDLVNFYHDHDITAFVYDFNGRVYSGSELSIRELMTSLIDLEIFEKSFIYSCNITPGQMMKGSPIIRATDVMAYNLGFDVIGDNHIRRKFPPEIIEELKSRCGNSAIRLFNSEDYGYYKTAELSLLKGMYPSNETDISFDTFKKDNAKSKQCQVLFNTERIGLESLKYRNILNDGSEATNYLKTKEHIRAKDLQNFMEFRNSLRI